MINVLTPPPETIKVNEHEYSVDSDYRTWITVSEMLDDIDYSDTDKEENIITIARIIQIVFGKIINEPYDAALLAILEFMRGYPKPGGQYADSGEHERLFSFRYDINYIIIAIRNQSGIDLSYRRSAPFHWWNFLLELSTLEDRHYISKVIGYRAYKGKDKELLRLKNKYALPKGITRTEQQLIRELDDIFYNS